MTDMKVLIGGDQQYPFHNKRAVDLWFKVLKRCKWDEIWITGDLEDYPQFSRWTDGGSEEFLSTLPPEFDVKADNVFERVVDESAAGRQFFQEVRKAAPNARIFFAGGNHDIVRPLKYFDKKMPEILPLITEENLWGLDSLGVEYIRYWERPKHMYGGLHVHHGVAISKHAGESVKSDIESFGVSLIRGHSHRLGNYNKSYPLREETLQGWEAGHMMDIKSTGASYDNVHNWQLGFMTAIVESGADTKDGYRVHPQLVPISNEYTCSINGRVYKG